jgi:hypothetical protein
MRFCEVTFDLKLTWLLPRYLPKASLNAAKYLSM